MAASRRNRPKCRAYGHQSPQITIRSSVSVRHTTSALAAGTHTVHPSGTGAHAPRPGGLLDHLAHDGRLHSRVRCAQQDTKPMGQDRHRLGFIQPEIAQVQFGMLCE
jgi:hypothetical protein